MIKAIGANDGEIVFVVWPTHVGVATDQGEPGTNPFYERGVISWHPDNDPEGKGRLVGRARVHVPKGTYTHFIYYHTPIGGRQSSMIQMDHPYRPDSDGILDIWPIFNGDQLGA